jgi:hypothetical protein
VGPVSERYSYKDVCLVSILAPVIYDSVCYLREMKFDHMVYILIGLVIFGKQVQKFRECGTQHKFEFVFIISPLAACVHEIQPGIPQPVRWQRICVRVTQSHMFTIIDNF